jgi:putative tryptophan/tyrosine transport system substrate-binding protein
MCRLLPRLLLLALLFVHAAQAGNVALVLSETSGPYAEFSSIFQDALDSSDWKISTQGMVDSYDNSPVKPDLIVTAGGNAFRQIMGRIGNTPVIATLIPRQAYEKTLAEVSGRNRRTTAIFLDQPPARLASFLRHTLPGRKRVGMLISGETQNSLPQFRQAFNNAGLTLDSEDSDGENTLLPTLGSLLPRVDLLLATPDSRIYRRDNTKAILVTTYRYQRPVIAFSAAFVTAGALAALYSTPAQIARQTAELTLSFSNTLPPPMSPSQFAVAINHNVAQALDLSIQDEASIRRAMLADKEAR